MTRLLLFILFLNINCFGQVTRTNYWLFFELQDIETGKSFEYSLNSKNDSLQLDITQSKENFSGKHKLDKNKSLIIFEKGIIALEKINVDYKKETDLHCNFFVRLSFAHNFQGKTVYINDRYYFDQIVDYLLLFNENVPDVYRIPLSKFDFKLIDSIKKSKQYEAIGIDWKYNFFDNGHTKNKSIYYNTNHGDTLKVQYTAFKKHINNQFDTLILPHTTIDSLFLKSIRFINNYKYSKTMYNKENNDYENFEVSYYSGGINVIAGYKAFKLVDLNTDSKNLIRFLNTMISPKRPFE
jgi:hypothetical protein